MIDAQAAQGVIVGSIGCGNADLTAYLQSNIDSLWCSVREPCEEGLRFYRVQLSAIEAAQSFVRHRIDESHSKSQSTSQSSSSTTGFSDSQGQSSNQGTSCSYSTAVTLAQSRSDTVSSNQSEAVADSHGDSYSQSHSWDRSTSDGSGSSQSYNNSVTSGWGDSFNYNVTHIIIDVQAHSRENGPGPMMSLSPGFPVFTIAPPFFSDPQLGDEYNNPGFDLPPYPGFRCGAVETTRPNYGQWWSGQYNVEISTPIFDAGATWESGADFDQVHIVTTGCDESSTDFITEGTSDAESRSDSVGQAISHSESQSQQDAHSISGGGSDSRSDSTSTSNSLAQGSNETHSESNNEGRSDAQSSGQATAWGKTHSESKSSGSSNSTGSSSSIMWSQIFANLNELWKRTFAEIQKRDTIKAKQSFAIAHNRLPSVYFGSMDTCRVGRSSCVTMH